MAAGTLPALASNALAGPGWGQPTLWETEVLQPLVERLKGSPVGICKQLVGRQEPPAPLPVVAREVAPDFQRLLSTMTQRV